MKIRMLLLIMIVNGNISKAVSQIQAYDAENGDIITLMNIQTLENIIDSCHSQIGIGAALNNLSNYTWQLDGAGQNITNGDSLFFSLRTNVKNRGDYFAWVMDNNYDATNPEYPTVKLIFSEYLLQFQFSDKRNIDLIVRDITQAGYKKIKEEFVDNYSVLRFEKNKRYRVDILTVNTGDDTIYLYQIYNIPY